ncbi:hypothetical protein HYX19_00870 [Candidatus Woesearchaeota archaeon]|nr:hypothetical protein [Candidatus Woesearchaeota archaeon]
MRLPRLSPMDAFVLNQYVICKQKVDGFEEFYQDAKKLNKKFVKQYLSLKGIDVYFATSMRSFEDYKKAERICNELEELVVDDNDLGIYSPAANCESSRVKKFDLEKHMITITKTLVINAGEQDTGGKFIEAMYAKSLGKPILMLAENERMYKIYHDYHPSSLTLGMHVCKNVDMLKKCLKMELTDKVKHKSKRLDGKTNKVCSSCDSILSRL